MRRTRMVRMVMVMVMMMMTLTMIVAITTPSWLKAKR